MNRVLFVDDDSDIRASVREVLQDEGFEVVLAADGLEALAVLEHFQPDVLVVDWMMPNLNGSELLSALSARGLRERFPILVATASRIANPSGVAGVLRKPFSLDALIDALHAAQDPASEGSACLPDVPARAVQRAGDCG